MPLLSKEYGVSASLAGVTISAVVFSIALASLVFGPVADAAGRKRTMVAGCTILAIATLACAFAPNFPSLVVLRAIQGIAIPAVTAVAIAYLGELRGSGDPGSFVGLYIGATVLGGLAGRVASGLIAQVSSWRVPFVVFSAVTLLAAIGLATALKEEPKRVQPPAFGAMRDHLLDPRLAGGYVVGATLFFGFIGIFTYLPYLLAAPPYDLSTGAIAWFYASYGAGVVTAPLVGRASKRLSRRLLMAGGLTIAIAGILMTALHGLFLISAGTVVLCIGMFTAQAVAPAYVNIMAKPPKGGANALYQTFYYGGAIFGSTLPGLALEHFGWNGVVAACALSLALGVAAVFTLCADDRSPPQLLPR